MSGSRIIRELGRTSFLLAYVAFYPSSLSGLDPGKEVSQYVITHWSPKQLFPAGAVNAIAQTPDGYLWLGAEGGLLRFDGAAFKIFEHANTPRFPRGHVVGLVVDLHGSLWVRMKAPYLMRYRAGEFEQAYAADSDTPGITAIARDNQGRVLVSSTEALLRFSGSPAKAERVGSTAGLAISLTETADGAVWLGMRDLGLRRVRDGIRSDTPGLPDSKVNILLPSSGNRLWIGTDSGLARWDGNRITQDGVPSVLLHSPVLALAQDRDSNLWASTPSGVVRVTARGASSLLPAAKAAGHIQSIFEDREGSVWMGGASGLIQIKESVFTNYEELDAGVVHVDRSGTTWVGGASRGLTRISGANKDLVELPGLRGDTVYALTSRDGELWIGRREGGLTRLRVGRKLTAVTYSVKNGLGPGSIYSLHRARDSTIWAGTLRGAVSQIHNGHITTFTKANGLTGDPVMTITETRDGAIWAGAGAHLLRFRDGVWTVYSGNDGLPPGRVTALTTDADDKLWIGTSAGLFYWSGSRAEPFAMADNLKGEVLGLAADDVGGLWVAVEARLFRILSRPPTRNQAAQAILREFGVADGILSTEFIRRGSSITRDPLGRIWLLAHRGVSVVDPRRLADLPPVVPIIEAVTVDGKMVRAGAGATSTSDHRRVVFSFGGVSLAAPDRVRYRYRLDTYDDDWSQPAKATDADYTNLPPGRYTFRLLASNGEGVWNGQEVTSTFIVTPRYWQTWWFRAVAACLVIATMVIAYRYRLARIRTAMNLRFEERLAERTRIAQELHDTLLQGFLSASMQMQVAADLLPSDAASRPSVERALELMGQVIVEGRNTLRGLRGTASSAIPLETALSQIQQEYVEDTSVDFRVVVDGHRRELHPILQDEVYRIGREALLNAFRHANASHIEVEVKYSPQSFRLLVRDDGKGIDAAVLDKGREGHWGLLGMRERAEAIGAHLRVFSRPSNGTEIELDIPGVSAYLEASGTRATRRKYLPRWWR